MPEFARPEFSVCQSGVSSSIAVTTYLIRRLLLWITSILGDDDREEA
jgi:hypothetical protein